jgi:hypothetical protein
MLSRKSNKVTSFEEKCNEFLVIRYRILNVTVPLQLLVTDILNVTKTLLVTTKSN